MNISKMSIILRHAPNHKHQFPNDSSRMKGSWFWNRASGCDFCPSRGSCQCWSKSWKSKCYEQINTSYKLLFLPFNETLSSVLNDHSKFIKSSKWSPVSKMWRSLQRPSLSRPPKTRRELPTEHMEEAALGEGEFAMGCSTLDHVLEA